MKVYYFNDEPHPVNVRIMDSRWDAVNCIGDFYALLQAAEGRTFDLDIKEGYTLYIKKWKGMVMLTTVSLSVLENIGESFPPR